MKIKQVLGSVKTAIVLIVLLVILFVIGSIVPQGPVEKLTQSTLVPVIKDFLLLIQATNIYYSPLFLFLTFLFFVNLTICTLTFTLPVLKKIISKKEVKPPSTLSEDILTNPDLNLFKGTLQKMKYTIYENLPLLPLTKGELGENIIMAQKGIWTKFGPIITHLSLYIILIGVLIGLFTGFKSYILLSPQEPVDITTIQAKATNKGVFMIEHKNWQIKLNKFWMKYRPDNSVEQYYSDVSIMSDEKILFKKLIWVNEPLQYDGVDFYQSEYEPGGLKMLINNKEYIFSVSQLHKNSYISEELDMQEAAGLRFYIADIQDTQVAAISMPFKIEDFITTNRDTIINKVKFRYVEPVFFTGLSVKSDIAIPIIWFGFATIIIGLLISALGYRRIWLQKVEEDKYKLYSNTNRGDYLLQNDIKLLKENVVRG